MNSTTSGVASAGSLFSMSKIIEGKLGGFAQNIVKALAVPFPERCVAIGGRSPFPLYR